MILQEETERTEKQGKSGGTLILSSRSPLSDEAESWGQNHAEFRFYYFALHDFASIPGFASHNAAAA